MNTKRTSISSNLKKLKFLFSFSVIAGKTRHRRVETATTATTTGATNVTVIIPNLRLIVDLTIAIDKYAAGTIIIRVVVVDFSVTTVPFHHPGRRAMYVGYLGRRWRDGSIVAGIRIIWCYSAIAVVVIMILFQD